MTKLFPFFLCLFLFGCAVGPKYDKPTDKQLNLQESWHFSISHGGSNIKLLNWWEQLNDPILTIFINSAIETNPTIFEALAKIKQAQANLKASRSFLFPSLTSDVSASINQNSMTTNSSGGGYSGDIFTNNGLADGGSAGLNMSWELDLFGANRYAIEASQARYMASKLDWNDAKVSLAAQVADVYVSLRECQSLILVYRDEKQSRESTLQITQLRVKSGFSARSDGNQASGSLYQNNANLAKQKSICGQYENQLVALTGLRYESINNYMSSSYGVIPIPKEAAIAFIPAQIINQRPDVASAERSLSAANADLGVAIANRYPQVSLAGSISANVGSLYVGQPNSWSLGPSISLPILDGGYLSAQESLNYAKYEEAYAAYQNKVINAIREVEDALVRINFANDQVLAAESATKNYQEYFDAYNKKYTLGWTNLLDLETVRITLISSREVLLVAKLELVEAWIALYKAVGGGWSNNDLIGASHE